MSYNTPDTGEFIRVLTGEVKVGTRGEAERTVDVAIVAMNGVHQTAKLAQVRKIDTFYISISF